VVVEEEADPPQPTLNAVPTSSISPRTAAGQMPREVSFFLRKNSGNSRNGSKMPAEDVLETVSGKTTVT
jgi:hypothetical protein